MAVPERQHGGCRVLRRGERMVKCAHPTSPIGWRSGEAECELKPQLTVVTATKKVVRSEL